MSFDDFGLVLSNVWGMLQVKYDIWGFSISAWNIAAFAVISDIVFCVVWRVINRD